MDTNAKKLNPEKNDAEIKAAADQTIGRRSGWTSILMRETLLKKPDIVLALTSVILLPIQTPFEERVVDHLDVVKTILLSGLLSLVMAITICPIFIWIWRRWFGKLLSSKPKVEGIIRLTLRLLLLLVAVITLYFSAPQTHLWQLTQLWWYGPRVDLASTNPEKINQSIINLPWVKYGLDFGQTPGWTREGISQKRETLDKTFQQLSEKGVKGVLWFLLCDGRGAPIFDQSNDKKGDVTGLDPTFWADYDAVVEAARKYRMGILWVLVDFKWMAPAKDDNGASLFGHVDIIENDDRRESFFRNALIPILRRYPLEPQIIGWIIINEPENALKEGHILSDKIDSPEKVAIAAERIQDFTRRASAHIKHYTYRQPVSIGSADLESLLEYWGSNPANFDFFVFHHYESYMPPPASQIQSLVGNKPVYVGEFKIQSPPLLPLDEFVTKSRWLGYAGAWPWSLNDDPARSPYDEIQQISNTVSTAGSAGPTPISNWWDQHRDAVVIPMVNQTIRRLEEERTSHTANCDENRLWKNRTESLLGRLDAEISTLKSDLTKNTEWLRASTSGAASQQKQIDENRKPLDERTENHLREAGGLLALEESRTQRNQQAITGLRNKIESAKEELFQLETEVRRPAGADQATSRTSADINARIGEVERNLMTIGGYLAIEQGNKRRAQAAIDATNTAIDEKTQEKERQKGNLKMAIERMAQRCSLAKWTRYKSAQSRSLYLR